MKIIVDGYCLGNPGQAGYKGINADTKEELFKEEVGCRPFPVRYRQTPARR